MPRPTIPPLALSPPGGSRAVCDRLLESAQDDVIAALDLIVRAGAKLRAGNDLLHLAPAALDLWLDLSGCSGTLGRIVVNGDFTRLTRRSA